MKPDWEELGRQLEEARGSLYASSVAEALGFSGKQLRNYERAIPTSGRPGAQRLIDLAAYYGTDPRPWLDLVGYAIPRRVAGSIELSGGIGRLSEGSDTLDPIAKAGGRGEEDLSDSERKVVRDAAALLAQSAALTQQAAAMLQLIGETRPDDA